MTRSVRFAFLFAAAIVAASVVAAQTGAPPAPAGKSASLLSIVWQGIEWPAYFIVIGSVVVIALIAEHFITIRGAAIAPAEQFNRAKLLIEARSFRECFDTMRGSSTFFARLMAAALGHARHGFDAMHEAAIEKSGELSGKMFRKVEYLSMIGNLGPLMGLLGTVYGMIVAFSEISGGGGAADPSRLTRGISLALVNTMLGLMLAVVGLGFFSVCRNRVDSLTTAATVQVLDLLEYFRPAAAKTSSEGAQAASAARRATPATAAAEQPVQG
ncbi:MAG: MotA/TolQ/ExbB proton channel family protein [Phycisphaerae bacterium]